MSKKYRRELDGLRAIAVTGVLLHHAFPNRLTGGYLGVDVFFVISGYLITRLLKSDMEAHTFRYSNFYERRIRRIVPALTVVQFLTNIGAIMILVPQLLLKYCYGLIASNFFVQNFYLWSESGYFDSSSQLKPLGHLWTLSIEEQFYIVLPLIMKMIEKMSDRTKKMIYLAAIIMSLCSSEFVREHDSNLNFFLTTSRVWELFVGSFIAVADLKHSYRSLNMAGLVGILVSMRRFTPNSPHPGLYTVIPVLSTALILTFAKANEKSCPTMVLLSVKPMRIIGLISYSLYLVHQPIFSLTRLWVPHELETKELLCLIGICILTAAVSYVVVEQPFRSKEAIGSSVIWFVAVGQFVAHLVICLSALAVLNFNYITTETFGLDMDPTIAGTFGSNNFTSHRVGSQWMILGDSHAESIEPELRRRLQRKGLTLSNKIHPGCPVLHNFHCDFDVKGKDTCFIHNKQILQQLQMKTLQPDVIVISVYWLKYLNDDTVRNEEGAAVGGVPIRCTPDGTPTNYNRQQSILAGYKRSVEEILKTNHTVILIYSIPIVGWYPAQRLRQLGPNVTTISTSFKAFLDRQHDITEVFDQIQGYNNLVRIYSHKVFCNRFQIDRCVANKGKVMFYMDDNHLNNNGVNLLIDELIFNLQIKI